MEWLTVCYRSLSASQVAFSCLSDPEGTPLGVQLDLVSLGAYHEVSEHTHPLLPGRHTCSGCSVSWGKEIGLVQVASKVSTNPLKCSAPFTLTQLGMGLLLIISITLPLVAEAFGT